MVEFRTSSGLVSSTPMMRTASGLVECAPQFRGGGGLVDTGSGAPLTAQVSPSFVSGARGGVEQRVYTNVATVSAAGGKPPYTYSWAAVDDWQVTSPTSASSSFSTMVAPGGDAFAAFTCTVTDARGSIATANVSATAFNYGGSGGIIP